jgi:hypothetical protein
MPWVVASARCATKRIVHIRRTALPFLRQRVVILFLTFVDAAVFQQYDLARCYVNAFQPVLA